MGAPISPPDLERLSAFLDNQLPAGERNRLQARLLAEPDLKAALEALRRTRATLRAAPRLRAPRSFRLSPDMAAPAAPGRLFPALRMTSVLATFLLAALLTGELALAGLRGLPLGAAAPVAEEPFAAAQAPVGEAGEMETAAPTDSTAVGAEPAEGEMTLMAAPTETPPGPPELAAPADQNGAFPDAAEFREVSPLAEASPPAVSPLRAAQIALAALALASGLAAWRLRRRR
jgi:hypothetical protein